MVISGPGHINENDDRELESNKRQESDSNPQQLIPHELLRIHLNDLFIEMRLGQLSIFNRICGGRGFLGLRSMKAMNILHMAIPNTSIMK